MIPSKNPTNRKIACVERKRSFASGRGAAVHGSVDTLIRRVKSSLTEFHREATQVFVDRMIHLFRINIRTRKWRKETRLVREGFRAADLLTGG